MAESEEVVMRLNRMPSLSRPGAGYFEDSDTDEEGELKEADGLQRSISIDECTVELPVAHILPKGSYREGHLYKQGGVKNDQGWKKRWMKFDGQSLRYYKNNKTHISLRIVPVSLMNEVEIVKNGRPTSRSSSNLISSSTRQFQFTIKCKNRTFLFGTDDLDNCTQWSNTIMEAILKHKKSEYSPDCINNRTKANLTGCAKFNGKSKRFYMALKGGVFYYYYNEKDFEVNMPVHELDMKTTRVKEIDGKLDMRAPPDQRFTLQFDTDEDMQQWKEAFENATAYHLGDDEILNRVRATPGNEVCADCGVSDPEWASLNLCIVICEQCAGIHRGLDVDITKIRSLRMDEVFTRQKALTQDTSESSVKPALLHNLHCFSKHCLEAFLFERIGNVKANAFWNHRKVLYSPQDKCNSLDNSAPSEHLKDYISKKYKDKSFCDTQYISEDKDALDQALCKAVMVSDLVLTMKLLHSGADILCQVGKGSTLTVFEMAKEMHDEEMMEYLLQNGGNVKKEIVEQNGQISDSKPEHIYLDGYLDKTGKNLKGFRKRKCVLDNSEFKYYKGNDLKGSFSVHNIVDISEVEPVDKRLYCFHVVVTTGNNTRTYRFSAIDEHTRKTWVSYIRKSMDNR